MGQNNSTAWGQAVEFSEVYRTPLFVSDPQGKDSRFPVLLPAIAVRLEHAAFREIPAQCQLLALPALGEVADGELPERMGPVEFAGQQVIDPIQAAGVVHVAVAVQVRIAHGAAAAAAQLARGQGLGYRQLRAPQGAGHGNAAFAGEDHVPGVQIHQHPKADGAEALVSVFVIGHHASGVGSPGGGHGPGFHPDGLSPGGEPGNLNPVPDHGPEHPAAGQGVIVQSQGLAVRPGHLLGIVENGRGLQVSKAIHGHVVHGEVLYVLRFH